MPYFEGRLEERNGEQEYSHDHIIQARTLKDAEEAYERYAKQFYPGKPDKGDGGFYFLGGAIWVGVDMVRRTTKAAWMQQQFSANSIRVVSR